MASDCVTERNVGPAAAKGNAFAQESVRVNEKSYFIPTVEQIPAERRES